MIRAFLWRQFKGASKYTIAINMAGCSPLTGGVGNYTESLLRGWARYIPWNPLSLYCTKYNFELVRKLPLSCRLQHHYLHQEEDLRSLEGNFDLLYCPFGKITPVPPPAPTVFHFADIQDYFFPEFFSLKDLSLRRNSYRSARAFAEHILVPSEFSKKSIMASLQLTEELISVVPLPVADLPKKTIRPSHLQDTQTPFLYYPADNYAHKNHRRLFLAVAKLLQKGWKGRLICTGGIVAPEIDLEGMAREVGIENHFTHLGKIPRSEVAWLFQHATLLVFPSLFEGYGLPLLEAFEMGLPIVCSGATSLPELGGDAVLYCNPFEVDDIAEKILKLWNDKELQNTLASLGRERRKLFSTKQIVEQHLAVFSAVIKKAKAGTTRAPLKTALPEVDLKLTEALYLKNAHPAIQSFIPARELWFKSDQVVGAKDHGTSFTLAQRPKLQKSLPSKSATHGSAPLLPVHFFTIVYNGMPFIKRHLEVFQQLPLEWHWHIIEGAAELNRETSWNFLNGGQLPEETSILSSDGTTEYLNLIAAQYPDKVTLYRKNGYWQGKLEMIKAPLSHLPDNILLWEVDVDEMWSRDQIAALAEHFQRDPTRSGASFYCRFFVGPNYIADNIGSYGNNPSEEWRRVWNYKKGDAWTQHAPPHLVREVKPGLFQEVMALHPFTQEETWRLGLVFDHLSYVEEKQVQFKEAYYGYAGATDAWRKIKESHDPEILVSNYCSWVKDSIWAFKLIPLPLNNKTI